MGRPSRPHRPRSCRPLGVAGVLALAVSIGLAGQPTAASAASAAHRAGLATRALAAELAPYPAHCPGWSNPLQRADDVLLNRWRLSYHPVVTLPADRSWTENPLSDRNWQFLDHTLGIVHSLLWSYASTADAKYVDRATAIVRDWIDDNPRTGGPSPWAWNDHSTALRSIVLACATGYLSGEWLTTALELHGRTLADPAFYVQHGNHALDQMIGLLEIAMVLDRPDWASLAVARMDALALESIDAEGVTNEQSVGYQGYNYARYRHAAARIKAAGLTVPASFSRVDLMPNMLAHATLPIGEYEMIGDTDRTLATPHKGTWAEFTATKGASGPRPPSTVALYRAGYLFARTGWGDRRAFTDETFMSLRWGPAPIIHGHADGGSLTLSGWGARLLVDPGKYSYNLDAWRAFFRGRSAHNVVTVDGVGWARSATRLLGQSQSLTMVDARIRMLGYAGVTHDRRVTFSRNLGYVLVEDKLASTTYHTYRQLWHLTEDARPYVSAGRFRTQRTRGNVMVRQLIGPSAISVVSGRTSPIQGWVSWRHLQRKAAPVVRFARSGRNVRFLTLIVTAPGQPAATVTGLTLTSTGYRMVVTIGTRSERVVVDGTSATITRL